MIVNKFDDGVIAGAHGFTDYPHRAGVITEEQGQHLTVIAEKLPHWFCWHRACGDPGREGRAPLNPSKVKREGITPGPVTSVSASKTGTASTLKFAVGLLPVVDGVGCALISAAPGVIILDLDHVRDAITGQLNSIGAWALKHLKGAYVEISPSGTGLRAAVTGFASFEGKKFYPLDQDGNRVIGPDGKETAIEIFRGGTGLYTRMTGALVRDVGVARWVDAQGAIDWVHHLKQDSETRKHGGKGMPFRAAGAGTAERTMDQVLDALARYRGDWAKDINEACNAVELTVKRSPVGALARALDALRNGKEKSSDEDYLILCEAIRRGVDSVEDAADLLLALAGNGARQKVKDRKDYRLMTAEKAARAVLAELESGTFNRLGFRKWQNLPDNGGAGGAAPLPDGLADGLEVSGGVLARNRRGDLIAAPANVKTILISDPRTCRLMAFNESTHEVERIGPWTVFDQHASLKNGNLQDIDISFVQAWMLLEFGLNLDKGDVCEGIEMAARAKTYDPMRDSLMALKWDRVERVRSWLRDFAKIDDMGCAEYVSEAGVCFLVGAVARALSPGCELHTVLTVEGSGGGGKSSMFQILADAVGPDLFTDSVHDVTNSVHLVECTEGKFIVEIAELSGFKRAADVESLKKGLTARRDKVRKPYMRKPVELPRRFVFVATTNSDQYIADPTGAAARRFHPVRTKATEQNPIDRAELATVAPQLWAEAVHMYVNLKQEIHIDPNSVAGKQWAVQRGERQEDLPFAEEVTKLMMGIEAGTVAGYWLGGASGVGGITANDAALAMGLDAEKVADGKYADRIAKALKAQGFVRLPSSNGARRWNMPPGLFQAASRMNAELAKESEL